MLSAIAVYPLFPASSCSVRKGPSMETTLETPIG